MKDYYKVLGVKKNASEEGIRERWLELTRKLHPDRQTEETREDERIREINEAYQVLKHSSTRVEYDLKRAYDQRKRKFSLRRLSIPIAIFVVLVMMGAFYLRKSQIDFQANLPAPIDPSTLSHSPAFTHQRIDASTPLIATEEEVRRFFADYTERYTQKDLDSFMSLFSSRAIQNRQDGWEGIRKIYGDFLKQSQEIKYDIDHIEIEIYENGVEARARYELVQMMKTSGDKRTWRGEMRWALVKEDGALKILSLDYQPQRSP